MDPQINPAPIAPVVPKRAIYLLVLMVVVICGYLLAAAFKDYQGSGVLKAQSPDSKAALSISQTDHQAVAVGVGKAKVRLPAGTYEVASSFNGGTAFMVAVVKKGQTTSITLPKNKDSYLPSIDSINFQGTDELISQGFTTTQVAEYKEYIFSFKNSAGNAIIDTNSVKPGPHDPNTDIGFSTTMNLSIDSAQYSAKLTNTGLDDLRIYLYDSAGRQVFDSGI